MARGHRTNVLVISDGGGSMPKPIEEPLSTYASIYDGATTAPNKSYEDKVDLTKVNKVLITARTVASFGVYSGDDKYYWSYGYAQYGVSLAKASGSLAVKVQTASLGNGSYRTGGYTEETTYELDVSALQGEYYITIANATLSSPGGRNNSISATIQAVHFT